MHGCNCIFIIENKSSLNLMDNCKWNCELTQYLWKKGLAASTCSKKHITLENTKLLQLVSSNTDDATQIYGCRCSFEIATHLKQKYLSNTLYHHIYANHGCKGWPQILSWNKEILCRKKCSVQLNTVTYKEYSFMNHYNYFTAFSYQLLFH